ncbi:MAG TPA: PspA/IM30 family protein, partial [Asanoa sp.]|nr:PspA/IM30 family protein [Asanoa sp.]
NTPSFDEVRERIERRYANAMGRAELASNSVEGRMIEVQRSSLDMAGADRLEQIRASMAGEKLGSAAERPAVGPGSEAAAEGNGDKAANEEKQDVAGIARLDELRASMSKDKNPGGSSAAG